MNNVIAFPRRTNVPEAIAHDVMRQYRRTLKRQRIRRRWDYLLFALLSVSLAGFFGWLWLQG